MCENEQQNEQQIIRRQMRDFEGKIFCGEIEIEENLRNGILMKICLIF
jgi:hypothetical protein